MTTAGLLFAEHGFHNVTMNQIAGEVGVTGGALYRHFNGKDELLKASLDNFFGRIVGAFEGLDPLGEGLRERAEAAAASPTVGELWSRESRHLTESDRVQLARRLRGITENYRDALRERRPELDDEDAVLLGWSIQSVLASTSAQIKGLSVSAYGKCLLAACRAVIELDLQPSPGLDPTPGGGFVPLSKREKLLSVAMRLFGERGFQNTSLSDIGAEADVSGQSLYTHFENKDDVLVAVLTRANHALWLDLHAALDISASEVEALERVVESYVALCRSQPYLISVLVSESGGLPATRRNQLAYLQEWVSLLMASRPELTSATARALVRSAITVINDLNSTPGLARRPGFRGDLVTIAGTILHARI